jgi:hypothetical protein
VAHCLAVKITPQIELRGEFGRRQGSQAETVLAPIIVEGEVQVLENQRRRIAPGVLPDHRCAVDANALLRQHPVRNSRVAALPVDRDAGDIELAVASRRRCSVGSSRRNRLQAQLQPWQRRPGEDALDAAEGQRRLPLGIGDANIGEDQVGIESPANWPRCPRWRPTARAPG